MFRFNVMKTKTEAIESDCLCEQNSFLVRKITHLFV